MSAPRADSLGTVRTVELAVERVQPSFCQSERVGRVGLEFGLPLHTGPVTVVSGGSVRLGPGRLVVLFGPSGAGKSSALARIAEQYATATSVGRVAFPSDRAIIDAVAPWATLREAIELLTACGLGDAHLWVRRFTALSDGERFRACLARASAVNARTEGVAPLLCDEFCSALHRRAARAISFNLRKLVTRRRLSVVLACGNEDVLGDLNPDAVVRLGGRGACVVDERAPRPRGAVSLRRRLRITRGSKRDYVRFASMHYRATYELGFVDKVFLMRDGADAEPVGIVVYSHGPLELALRNRATHGRFVRKPREVNRRFRMLRRLVIHPDLRGCGLGHYLVRTTLPLVGTEYVECLAGMGEYNPVFERAGMKRIGRYDTAPRRRAALEALRAIDVDPNDAEFTRHVCRRRQVREIVADTVYDWYASTTAGGARRVERQSPEFLAQTFRGLVTSRPVYYLWRRPAPRRASSRKKKVEP